MKYVKNLDFLNVIKIEIIIYHFLIKNKKIKLFFLIFNEIFKISNNFFIKKNHVILK